MAQQQPATQPQYSPETWGSGIALMTNGTVYVQVVIHHIGGTHVSFIEPDRAESIAKHILDAVREARTGLTTPPNGRLIVPGEPQ